jgi:hypothetical protein
MRWAGCIAHVGRLEMQPQGNRPLGRFKMWEDSIKMDLKEIGLKVGNRLNWLRIGSGWLL